VRIPASKSRASTTPTPTPHTLTGLAELDLVPSGDLSTRCGGQAAEPVPDGQPIVVSLPPVTFTVGKVSPAWWKNPPYADPGWQLQFLSLAWLRPLAQRAYNDNQKQSLDVVVEQVLTFHRQNPDPGDNRYGWDEGTALRRLQTENCLYALTRDARLVPAIQADVAVQYSDRFYGPPLHAVHNHGVMADLYVLEAADLLGRTAWRDRSIARLKSEAPQAFTAAGTSKEQSSSYHVFNVSLWFRVVDAITRYHPRDPAIAAVRAIAQRGDRVSAWLTEPDGLLTVFGDASRDKGVTRSTWTARTFRDDAAGVVVGRWAWKDPLTSYYVIRYGPPRWAHGQQDRGGITWSALGKRILVNPGRAVYDAVGNYRAYAMNPVGHNVAWPTGKTLDSAEWVKVTASNIRAPWHQWATTDALFGVKHVRQMSIGRDADQLTVADTFNGGAAFQQVWHLDPGWTLSSRSADTRTLVFNSGTRTLTLTTTGTGTTLAHGVTRPTSGWWFPDAQHRVAAYQVIAHGKGTATTTFTIR
jgi:Heparinase II/III-like protein/Heparinase II/III N-terminus